MKGALGFVMLGIAGFLAYMAFRPQATENPNIKAPDANDTAKGARDAGNSAADVIAGWDQTTWQMIGIGILALMFVWAWFSKPKFRWFIIGGGVIWLVLMAAT